MKTKIYKQIHDIYFGDIISLEMECFADSMIFIPAQTEFMVLDVVEDNNFVIIKFIILKKETIGNFAFFKDFDWQNSMKVIHKHERT